ncbi:DUF421 domain-containing protein [Mumia sp. zg.B53]|uniref:DUF421 domain-containing protein n=1 Tax=unclassified Mumia TaxID=2621872 RepID=UPI001C6F0534|nr:MULTISPECIES: YetF domain-containing protein [unclassified Mumia]MBW9207362.1 DUF421 domain-containing protein [Mumia sp. zg.B17]MBW9210290.1 DUF421 domain-containing protein [Mumia sp. zg.B21]MBW9214900.1 DUF421 domain-containing protein [Mumia sp. zg.B53]
MEIVVRAIIIFAFLWLITRAVGRSTLGELSTFELILFIVMGDLVQGAVTQQDSSITGAVLAVGTFTLLTVSLSWLAWRFPDRLRFIKGSPVVVMRDGEPRMKVLRDQRLALEDLITSAREQGVRRLSDVEIAVLEIDGRISFFTYEPETTA